MEKKWNENVFNIILFTADVAGQFLMIESAICCYIIMKNNAEGH